MPEEKKDYTLSLRLPKDVYDKLVIWATKEHRSINGQIVYILANKFKVEL